MNNIELDISCGIYIDTELENKRDSSKNARSKKYYVRC